MTAIVETITGDAIAGVIPDLAKLRIEVFRDYPYLYDGSLAYEEEYLKGFAGNKDAIVVTARDGDEIVGCSTGSAMSSQTLDLSSPLRQHGYDIGEIFYFGESVLSVNHRGLGLGHTFFDHREAHARSLGYRIAAFAAVIRPQMPQPVNYRPLDAFWRKRGYSDANGPVASLSWKDIGQPKETVHPMQFWTRVL